MDDYFDGLLSSFQLSLASDNKAAKTIDNYRRAVVGLAEWLREHDLEDDATKVTASDVRGWLASQQGKVAESTVYRNYSGARQFFKWCVAEEELEVSPMANVGAPKVSEQETPMLTDEEQRALLKDCRGNDFVSRRDTAIISLFIDTGMRLSEMVGIELDSLDLRRRTADVVSKGDRQHRKRWRRVPFGNVTAKALDRYIRARRKHTFAHLPNLWLGEKGKKPMTDSGIRQMLERRGERLGIHIHPHMFRHGFADDFLEAGGEAADLQELAGWKSPAMIRRYGAARRAERARKNYQSRSPMDSL
jgi:site-specific recombinase XerD